MTKQASTFKAKSTVKAANLEHRRKINFNIDKYNAVVPAGKAQFTNLIAVRERAKNFGSDRMTLQTEAVYHTVLKGSK